MKLSCAMPRLVGTSVNHEITALTGPFSLTLFFGHILLNGES